MKQFHILVGGLICSLAVLAQLSEPLSAAGTNPQVQPTASGEIIVKFSKGTEADRLFAQAVAGGPKADAKLGAFAAQLSKELDTPITIERLTSGREFIIAVDTTALTAKLGDYLNSRKGVRNARPLDSAEAPERLYQTPTVMVEFHPDSRMHKALSDTAQASAAARDFATEVGRQLGIELTARTPRALELTIDINGVTQNLLERLKERPDVEYAQVNLLMRPYEKTIP